MKDAKPHLFVALYAGKTIGEAHVIAASDDSALVEAAVSALYSARRIEPEALREILSKNHRRAFNALGQQESDS